MSTANAAKVVGELPAGLRERKKVKTRDALSRAALDLFRSRGYEATTVDDIAASIDVSKRTFFRYFDGKEDVLLRFQREVADLLLEELRGRPEREEPLVALRRAGARAIEQVAAQLPLYRGKPMYLAVISLIESTPALVAAHLRIMLDRKDAIAGILAEREGVDPALDPRPRLLVSVYGSAVVVANRAWHEAGAAGTQALLDCLDRHLDGLGSAISGRWSA
ncbi:MAG TPA: TetR family transcriptional regulator [Actinocrinis sp.]|jgi:AcrR family transcriptional regulator|uniref:TetR family transcriptional regulator n=1 Tax=Actinocrinis sp. TaxID=1920516 RepID=UPI002DDCA113|nr:TetR family transcriptional regulator [Actinocrinis sp.]HEV3173606.1 TetR family transcriptional regulator [Actinocrinis sp.]